jgi:hypothetical protein
MTTPINVLISGGSETDREVLGDVFHRALKRNCFNEVTINHDVANDDGLESIFDYVKATQPNLFETKINIQVNSDAALKFDSSRAFSNPNQPILNDDSGRKRYKPNEIVEYIFQKGDFGYGEVDRLQDISDEDRWQFMQLLGESVDSIANMSYAPQNSIRNAIEREEKERLEHIARAAWQEKAYQEHLKMWENHPTK